MKVSMAADRVARVTRLVTVLVFLILGAAIADFFLLGAAGTLSAFARSGASHKKFGSFADCIYTIGRLLTLSVEGSLETDYKREMEVSMIGVIKYIEMEEGEGLAYLVDADGEVQVGHEDVHAGTKEVGPSFIPPDFEHFGGAGSERDIGQIADGDVGA